MIRHIVTWKLQAEDDAAKSAAVAEITEALLALQAQIPQARGLTVGRNVAYPDKNWDIVLTADFETLDDLDAYQVHPAHLAAAEVVRARVSARACVDFEV